METSGITSGVAQVDKLLGGLFIGDNVVWYDDAGSLASVFCMNFISVSLAAKKFFIYVSFDRSPKNLLKKLGPLAKDPHFTLLDCFTCGKGSSSEVFLKFYEENEENLPCEIIRVESPKSVDAVMDAFYGIHKTKSGDVRFVFESLTGMQDLWDGEENLLKFYTHSCPRLYELNTIAYWMIEKRAHSQRLKAHINQIAQVAIDLSVKRGKTSLTILKAENRIYETLDKPYIYWSKSLDDYRYQITFDFERRTSGRSDLGMRLKELRARRGLSQTEIAKLVGVTPSNISQVESNLIYPSLPALIKMAEILGVKVSAFFQDMDEIKNPVVFPTSEATEMQIPHLAPGVFVKRLCPVDFNSRAEPFFIEILPEIRINTHFFVFKGEELGYLLSGHLEVKIAQTLHMLKPGDMVYLTDEIPTQWNNPNSERSRLLWVKIR